jgi:hypothetical protein
MLRGAVRAADALEDIFTAHVLTERIGCHEHFAWLLRARLSPDKRAAATAGTG